MNVYDLAELTLSLTRAILRMAELMGYSHYARPIREVEAELVEALSLVEAREMVDPFDAA